MTYLNGVFFDEYKSLDHICRDIYRNPADQRLGVTLYLEDMDRNAFQGSNQIPGWTSDYHRLKRVRNLRNELSHSPNFFPEDICTQEDIDFILSFKTRIFNQTDPIAMLRKQTARSRSTPSPQLNQQPKPAYTHSTPNKTPAGCLGIVASFLITVACIIALVI